MFKKTIISAFAAVALMVGMQAPASAAMGVANPAVAQSEAASEIVKVGGRRHRGSRHRGSRRHGGFRRHRWGRHHRWHGRHNWGRHYYYRNCHWHHGRRYCGYH
ncbi:MAG: hypothetical protein ACI89J_002742 [Hyphomicrobiaceae bacterium]|jgi:hypothetical protein